MNISDEKSIYDLELHESITINTVGENDRSNSITILRVPGGWIYTSSTKANEAITQSSSFVSFNREFQKMESVDVNYTM